MGSVRDVGKGKFELRVELGYDASGKRIRKFKRVQAKNKTEAKKLLAKFETELLNGDFANENKISFKNFIEKWKKNVELDINTLETYIYILDKSILPYFESKYLKDIKTIHIVEYFKKEENMGTSSYSLEKRHRVIRNVFARAKEWGYIDKNPATNVKKPKVVRREKEIYTEKEIDKIFDILEDITDYHRLIIKLAILGGLRRGEIMGIDLNKDIDFKEHSIHICRSLQYTKTEGLKMKPLKGTMTVKKDRKIYLPDDFMKDLNKYRLVRLEEKMIVGDQWKGFKDMDGKTELFLLFGHEDGTPFMPTSVTHMWNKFVERYKLKKIHFHDLRHSSASYLLAKGFSMKAIQVFLGHSSMKTTSDIYAHVTDDMNKELATAFAQLGKKSVDNS